MTASKGGKFKRQADLYGFDLKELFNRAIRQALIAGLEAAVKGTKQDSSNAAAHWLLASSKSSRPSSRKFGKLRDLRGTKLKAPTKPVGYKGDAGKNASNTLKFVRDKEIKEVVDKLVSGRDPDTMFYLYNAIVDGTAYGTNANIDEAAQQGLAAIKRIFENRVAAGNVRKRFR